MSESDRLLDRKRQIIAAAETVFDANGYGATTMEAVASVADIAKGSIYNYFQSKRDLFFQVCLAAVAAGQADVERLASRPMSASAKIEQVVNDWYKRLDEYTRFGRLILEFWATAARQKRGGQLTEAVDRMTREGERGIQAIIEQGVASGQFRADVNSAVSASLIAAIFRGLTVQAIVLGSNIDEEYVAEVTRSILASLTAETKTRSAD